MIIKIKVLNLKSNKGNYVPNQFVIIADSLAYLQSYDSIIALIDMKNNKVFLDKEYWNYSRTTSKYRNIFLNENTKTIKNKVDSGEYKLINLQEFEYE